MADTHSKAGTPTTIPTKRLPFAIQLGFFAGLIWGGARVLFYYLHFTSVVPGFLIEPFFIHDFLAGTGGILLGWASFIVLSIAASLIYTLLLSKLRGPWPGVAYGLAWFAVIYLLLGPLFGMVDPIGVLSWDSIWTDGCVFLLWGAFIGYTVAVEFTDERQRDKAVKMTIV